MIVEIKNGGEIKELKKAARASLKKLNRNPNLRVISATSALTTH
jgi:hypothetical protein